MKSGVSEIFHCIIQMGDDEVCRRHVVCGSDKQLMIDILARTSLFKLMTGRRVLTYKLLINIVII